MPKHILVLLLVCAVAGAAAAAALSSAPPVGPLPSGPVKTVHRAAGATFTISLPAPKVSGRVWRIARAYDSTVVQELHETATRATYQAAGTGTTKLVYALTLGEQSRAYASRTFRVVVAPASDCPKNLLALTANPIGPAVTAALVGDAAKNRPQVTGATVAVQDTRRGPEVKRHCGAQVQRRTVVVYITDRALLPSASLSERILFVGRTPAGYRVWQRAH